MPAPTIICSLCQREIPAPQLRRHYEQEKKEIETYTIEFIKKTHPKWAEGDPTCEKCWDHYRKMAVA
jgi:hypothetical protein